MERLAQALQDDAIRALRRLEQTPESEHPRIFREVGEILVKLRAIHTTKDGRPDWRGQSWDYRQRVNDIYNGAGLPPEPNHPVKAAIRYHLGNALRDHLSEDELREAGLNPITPRDRQYQRFVNQSSLAEFARALVFHIETRLNVKADPELVKRAAALANRLNGWLAQQESMSSE